MTRLSPGAIFERAAATAVLCGSLACGQDPALVAHVAINGQLKATCVEVSVFETMDTSGMPSHSVRVARDAGKGDIAAAIFRGALPASVWVTARPLWSAQGCEEPVFRNGPPVVTYGTFPASGTQRLEMALQAPTSAQDPDGDGFVAAPDGADCQPGIGAANPAAPESCLQPVDYNCNALIGCNDPTCPAGACLPSPTKLAFTTSPHTLVAGSCSSGPVTVETQTAAGTPLAVVAPTDVSFSSPGAVLSMFAGPGCSTAVTQVTIAAGSTTASVYIRGVLAGTQTVDASAPMLSPTSQAQTINPGPATQLAFSTTPQTVALNGCSGATRVELRDQYGNPSPASSQHTVNLVSNGGSSVRFYSNSTCSSSTTTTATIAAGAPSATFYFFRTTAGGAGNVNVTATDTTNNFQAMQQETFVLRTATKLAFTSAAQTLPRDICSALATIQIQDASSQPAPLATATTVALTVNPLNATTFYSDNLCTAQITSVNIPASTTNASLYFRGDAQGAATITGTGGSLTPADQVENILAPVATKLVFNTGPQSGVAANACSAAVNIDSQGNLSTAVPVSADTAVNLALAPLNGLTLYAGAGCTGAPITSMTMLAGTSRVTISFRGTLAGNHILTATASGLTQAVQTEGISAGPANKVRILPPSQTVDAGACSMPVSLQMQDAYDNPVPSNGSNTVNLTFMAPSGGSFLYYPNSACTGGAGTAVSFGNGVTTIAFTFRGSIPQTVTITATPANMSLAGTSMPAVIQVGPVASLVFGSVQSSVAAGACSLVQLDALDLAGNSAPAQAPLAINVASTTLTNFALYTSATCLTTTTQVTLGVGSSSVQYWMRGTTVGAGFLTVTSNAADPPNQAVSVVAGPATTLKFTNAPITIAAGACSGPGTPLRVRSEDSYGNPVNVTGSAVPVTLSAPPAASLTFYSNNCTASLPGGIINIPVGMNQTAQFFLRANGMGTHLLTGTSGAYANDASQNLMVTAGPPVSVQFVNPPDNAQQGTCTRVDVQIQDTNGNASPRSPATQVDLGPTNGNSCEFYSNNGCGGGALLNPAQMTIPDGASDASYWFKCNNGSRTLTLGPVGGTGLSGASHLVIVN